MAQNIHSNGAATGQSLNHFIRLQTCAPSPCECTEISVEVTEGELTASRVTVRLVIDWPARSFRVLVIFTSPSSIFVTIAFTLLRTDTEVFHPREASMAAPCAFTDDGYL